MTVKTPKKKVKFHTPQNTLRLKAGYGGMDPVVMDRAETFIQTNDVDFTAIAKAMIDRLDRAFEAARATNNRSPEAIDRMISPIMELKANGAMFKFSLLSEVANIALDFLENIDHLNDDGFEIVAIHRRTLQIILKNQLRGSGGPQGTALIKELNEACARYHKKHNENNE